MAAGPVVLDGGLATQLEAQGHDLSTELWSARLLLDEPGAIREAHRRYFEAGAQVAISASYQASYAGFGHLGIEPAAATALMKRSVQIARQAAESADGDGSRRWVAASVGPYGAALADGSEYRGDYELDAAALAAWHRPRIEALADAGADLLALETIPCLAEVEALLSEVEGTGLSCWLSLTCADGRTRAGEDPATAFRMAAEVDEVVALGVNCTETREVAALVAVAAVHGGGKPVVAYPNSGEAWDPSHHAWTGSASFEVGQVDAWVGGGARLIGGCCRVGPAQIAEIAELLGVGPTAS